MKKKMLAAAAVSVAMMMAITGCGSSSSDDTTDATESADSTEEATATEETDEEKLANLASLEDTREELIKDIDSLVTLGEYKGVEVTITATTVSDEDVEAQITSNLEDAGEYEQITEGTVADGDVVNIDYVGTIDGEEFSGGSAEDANLNIGSNSFIDGFEDGLIGASVGDTVELNLTFPDDYSNTDLAGQDAVFTVTINYIQGDLVAAELTDDWVAEQAIDDVSTVDEYRTYIRTELEEEAEEEDEQNAYEELMATIIANSTINGYSEDLDKEERTEEEIATLEEYAEYYGMTTDELTQEAMGMTYDEYLEQLSQDIDDYFNRIMIYRAVIAAEDLQVTEDEYEESVLSYADSYSYYGYDSASAFVEENSKDIGIGLYNTAAENFLLDNANITKN